LRGRLASGAGGARRPKLRKDVVSHAISARVFSDKQVIFLISMQYGRIMLFVILEMAVAR
jgi:hypothetical protein